MDDLIYTYKVFSLGTCPDGQVIYGVAIKFLPILPGIPIGSCEKVASVVEVSFTIENTKLSIVPFC